MHPLVAGVTVLAASTVTVVGAVIASLILIGFVVYVIVNVHGGPAEAGGSIGARDPHGCLLAGGRG